MNHFKKTTLLPPIRIPYENGDELVHTDEHPYCADYTCPCWHANDTIPNMRTGVSDWATFHQLPTVARRRVGLWHRLKRWLRHVFTFNHLYNVVMGTAVITFGAVVLLIVC